MAFSFRCQNQKRYDALRLSGILRRDHGELDQADHLSCSLR
jgi:hypothetical protein